MVVFPSVERVAGHILPHRDRHFAVSGGKAAPDGGVVSGKCCRVYRGVQLFSE